MGDARPIIDFGEDAAGPREDEEEDVPVEAEYWRLCVPEAWPNGRRD